MSRAGLLSFARVQAMKESLGSPDALKSRREDILRSQAETASSIGMILQESEEGETQEEGGTVSVGTIPLLATLAGLSSSDSLPGWWGEVGLPRPDFARFMPILLAERKRLGELRLRHVALAKELLEIESAQSELAALARTEELLGELAMAWREVGVPESLPVRGDGCVALEEIRGVLAANLVLDEPAVSSAAVEMAVKWRELAKQFSKWADACGEVSAAKQKMEQYKEAELAHRKLEELRTIVDHVGGGKKGCFKDVLRTRLVEQRYQKDLNLSMKRVLRWYAHRRDVVENARIEFHRHGPLQVRVGPSGGVSTGIASLSRSQLTSLAFGLAVAANLGQPSLPTGFLCLDDVSDAFDLDNLAADAAMLRLLAYGGLAAGGYGRRQLILTNHNDQLTSRIVPLLLPPAGRRMRIVEFADDGHGRAIKVKQWAVRGEKRDRWEGESPLRTLLPGGRGMS